MKHQKCPICESQNWKTTGSKEKMFQFLSNRQCENCGTVWRPACPRWGAYVSILAGAFILFIGGSTCISAIVSLFTGEGLMFDAFGWGIALCMMIFGASAVLYGQRVLRGKTGHLKILTERTGYKPDREHATDVARAQKENQKLDKRMNGFEKATPGDIALSIIIPGWGIIIGLFALCKGERRRAATMIAIGSSMILFYIFLGAIYQFTS